MLSFEVYWYFATKHTHAKQIKIHVFAKYLAVNKNDAAGQETNSQQQSLKLRAGIMIQPWPNNSTKQKNR